MKPPFLYYRVKRAVPRAIQVRLRRFLAQARRRDPGLPWPIDPCAGRVPGDFRGWPGGKQFAMVLRHDVEGAAGIRQVQLLAELERARGLRSAFFFVPAASGRTHGVRSALLSGGFEIGVHGLTHDGMLYSSLRAFRQCVGPINGYLREWGAAGFSSPSSHHNFQWLHDLEVEYDTSSFDTDPFEPQPEGIGTVFPMVMWNTERTHAYVELPYTLPQDFTLFVILNQGDISTWTRKLEWIAAHRGMALLNTHPDYMSFPGTRRLRHTYDVALYERFLDHVQSQYGESCWHALPRDVARFWRSFEAAPSPRPVLD